MWGLTPESDLAVEPQLRHLARAQQILARNGHANMTLGHMSWRDPDGRGFWLKRSGLGFEEVTEADFILLDFNGVQLLGAGARHSEWPIHAEIYRARADVMVVVHSHPLYATTMSACDASLQGVCQEGVILHDKVSYYRRASGLIRTPVLGRDLAESLGDKPVVLMKNHGVTTCGPTIASAALAAIFLERACNSQLVASASGYSWSGPDLSEFAENVRLELNPHIVNDLWSYFNRQLDRAA